MKQSFAILAGTNWLLIAVTLGFGLAVSGAPADAAVRTALLERHFLLGVGAMLFTCFVYVLALTYFVVYSRMAKDAVETAGMDASALAAVVTLKRRAMRWLVLGVGSILIVGATGAMTSGSWAASPNWHLACGLAVLAVNTAAFPAVFALIAANVELTERYYGQLDQAGGSSH